MNMKEIEFQTASYEQWKEEAIKALKGKPFESLFTKTIENITLDPLYTEESLIEKLGEQLEKQVSTIRSLTKQTSFTVAQQIAGNDAASFFANIEDSLSRGNEMITINSPIAFDWSEQDSEKLASYLSENSFKFIVASAEDAVLDVFKYIDEAKRKDVVGYIVSPETIELANYPNVRTFCANTIPFHNDGANAVQELAIALAQAAKLANTVEDFKAFEQKFFVQFAVDTQFFAEVAKLRAFKVLWKAFASAFGNEASAVPVVVETSVRSFSKYDVYVNLLRAGNEAFSAAIGGADVITVHPHDALTGVTGQSVRIARNVSLVTKEESHVTNVIDPSGGSYFIESLTADYVKEAWALFLEIEIAGGLEAYGINAHIEEVYAARMKQVETRKHSLIGTNIYANPQDGVATTENAQFAGVKRLAIPFENLRATYAQTGIKAAILTFGELKNYKPRADFVQGFFATAGIVAYQTAGFQTIEDATTWLASADYDYVVVAATDEDTKAIIPALLENKKQTAVLDAAGKYKEEEEAAWTAAGLNGFIYAGQNIARKLSDVVMSVKGVQQ